MGVGGGEGQGEAGRRGRGVRGRAGRRGGGGRGRAGEERRSPRPRTVSSLVFVIKYPSLTGCTGGEAQKGRGETPRAV